MYVTVSIRWAPFCCYENLLFCIRNRSLDDAVFAPILHIFFLQRFRSSSNNSLMALVSFRAGPIFRPSSSSRPPCSPRLWERAASTGREKTGGQRWGRSGLSAGCGREEEEVGLPVGSVTPEPSSAPISPIAF